MVSATFIGEVHKGQLCFGQPLAEFEGKQVLITLIAPDAPVELSGPSALVTKPFTSPEPDIIEDAGRISAKQRERTMIQISTIDVGRVPMPAYSSDEED